MYRVLGSDQKEYGPVGADQVRQWILDRRLNANSLLQAEGSTTWQPLSMFAEFASTLSTAAPISPSLGQPSLQRGSHNPMAITGLVLSCLALVCCPCSTIFGVLGIVFSVLALSQIKQNPSQGGRELAIAGIAIGAVSLLGFIIAAIAGAFGQLLEHFRL